MKTKNTIIHIIGGGISGLIAAKVLESHGYSPIIIEKEDRTGGRLKTNIVDGFQLDLGFQVLLSNYSGAKKYLDYNSLEIQQLKPGACIFKNGKKKIISDPLRDPSVLLNTVFSGIGSLKDKIKIIQLKSNLKKKSIDAIFKQKETTTAKYLSEFGFSEKIITDFFSPFFTGIFLETKLETSSRMFEFIFKMFGEGMALIPKGGIEEIAKQLTTKLQNTTFRLNTAVNEVKDKEIILSDKQILKTDYTIIATEASSLVSNLNHQDIHWKSCENLYFKTPKRQLKSPFIGLIQNRECLINNLFYYTSIEMKNRGEEELLSVTVVKDHQLSETQLIEKIESELKTECNIENVTFLKRYKIANALPDLQHVQYNLYPSESKLTDTIFLSGDIQLNGSLNAAILSGESAAMGVINAIDKRLIK